MFEFPAQGARPVWIASYPRSGNTFLRILLQNCFHLASYSIYRVEGDDHPDPSAEALEDAPVLPRNWRERLRPADELPPVLIKTHGPPTGTAPAIFIARDGRAAIHSYYHYHKKFAFEQPSLTEVIAGACQFGSWSEHYRAWQPKARPRTLLVNYDELVSEPRRLIPRLASFLDVPAVEAELPEFEQLRQRSPAFFRRGQNTDYLQEWSPAQMALFNRLHGPSMEELGFALAADTGSADEAIGELAQSASRLHRMYLEQLSIVGQSILQHRAQAQEFSRQIQSLTDWIEKVHRPMARSRWVRLGMALRAVPAAPQRSEGGPVPGASQPADGPLRPVGGNNQSSSPTPRPGLPSVPTEGVSVRG